MRIRKLIVLMLLFLPLAWTGFLVWAFSLFPLRARYSQLWQEHYHLIDSVQPGSTGNMVSEAFEYMSTARGDYLSALENVLCLGLLPAFAIYFAVSLRKILR